MEGAVAELPKVSKDQQMQAKVRDAFERDEVPVPEEFVRDRVSHVEKSGLLVNAIDPFHKLNNWILQISDPNEKNDIKGIARAAITPQVEKIPTYREYIVEEMNLHDEAYRDKTQQNKLQKTKEQLTDEQRAIILKVLVDEQPAAELYDAVVRKFQALKLAPLVFEFDPYIPQLQSYIKEMNQVIHNPVPEQELEAVA